MLSRRLAAAASIAAAALALAVSCASPRQSAGLVQAIDNPAAADARLPRLAALPGGGVLMSWVETTPAGSALKFAILRDGRWTRSGEAARGSDWFLNWADFPSVVAIDEKFWIAHWLAGHPGGRTYDYDIAISVSGDAGATWSVPRSPHRDGAAAEHGFVTLFALDQAAGLVWLDGRDYVKAADKPKFPNKSGNFALRFARIERDGTAGAEEIVDPNVCTCCQTAAVATPGGAVAAWRGRTDAEIRDDLVARLDKGKWSTPQPLGGEGWKIAACPTNGPALSASANRVAAAWFSAEGDRPRVRASISNDAGASFGSTIEIDESSPVGRVGVAWTDSDTAVVSWIGQPDGAFKTAGLRLRRIARDGVPGPVEQIATVGAGRDSGVPQLVADAGCLLMAWTGPAPAHGIRTVRVGGEKCAPVQRP